MSQPKKARLFQNNWKEKYGFVPQGDRITCTLCCETIVARTFNVLRHFKTKHEASFAHMDATDRDTLIRKCVESYTANGAEHIKKYIESCAEQKNSVPKVITNKHGSVGKASYAAALCIARKGKPFTDGDFLKNTFLQFSEELFADFPNKTDILAKIKDVPLSAKTVQRRICDIVGDVDRQLKDDLGCCDAVSLTLHESTAVNDVTRLTIIARFFSPSRQSIIEEVCAVSPMTDSTTGADVLKIVNEVTGLGDEGDGRGIKDKIFSVTTDGAPSMVAENDGFASLLRKQLCRPILVFHFAINQENLCSKISCNALNDVMCDVTKIVSAIAARSSLTRGQFKTLLEEIERNYGEPLHCNARWLSRGKVLARFVELFDAIKVFVNGIGHDYPQLEDKKWMYDLVFLTDVTAHLNTLNVALQGKRKTVLNLYEEWSSFSKKLQLFEEDLRTWNLKYFPKVKTLKCDESYRASAQQQLQQYIVLLKEEFARRFQDLQAHGPMFKYILNPETATETSLELQYFRFFDVGPLELELIEFQSSDLWVNKFSEMRTLLMTNETNYLDICSSTWSQLPPKFSTMKKVAFALLSAFGTSYFCEQVFSVMKQTLDPARNRLTVENSGACLRIQMTNYQPNLDALASKIEAQGSH